jgi:cell fate (sporulation/competence/biofilm development) regulator YlbF (YheA/YmcA/DUF963 family)
MSKVKDEARKNQEWLGASLRFIHRIKEFNYVLQNAELKAIIQDFEKEQSDIIQAMQRGKHGKPKYRTK